MTATTEITPGKIIVSSKCMKVFLRRILARWRDREEKYIFVDDESFKIPALASSASLQVYAKPDKFQVPMARRTMQKLHDLCTLIEDQPVTLSFGYNSISINPVLI